MARRLVDVTGTTQTLPTVVAIHLAPASRLPVKTVDAVVAEAGLGLVGDRYHGSRHRHVSVQSATALAAAGLALGRAIDPSGTRRNITISHGEVPARPGQRITIGTVELEVVRPAAPCRLLDDWIGPGAYESLRGRSGSICRVLAGGTIGVGDPADVGPSDHPHS